jgi:hypothetical protein
VHKKRCAARQFSVPSVTDSETVSGKRYDQSVATSKLLLNSAVLDVSETGTAVLFNRMKDDNLKMIVIHDTLIKKYASLRLESLGRLEDQKLNDIHRVSQGARTLACLVEECRKTVSDASLKQLLQPCHFDLVVSATKSLAFSENKSAATLCRLMGNVLAQATAINIGDCLRHGDTDEGTKASNFKKLFQAEWNYRVNSVGTKAINTARRQTVKTIPLTDDLGCIRNYIVCSIKATSEKLERTKSSREWTWLAKLTLCRLIMFNRRRPAEVKDLKVQEYLNRPHWNEDSSGEIRMAMNTTDLMMVGR